MMRQFELKEWTFVFIPPRYPIFCAGKNEPGKLSGNGKDGSFLGAKAEKRKKLASAAGG